jgi:RNA polymerase sigma-70 factor, ECF subfamily
LSVQKKRLVRSLHVIAGVSSSWLPRPSTTAVIAPAEQENEESWLPDFHRGTRGAFERCVEGYIGTVGWAVGQILSGVDRETMVQEVFCRIFGEPELRRNFQGGNFGAWLITVARRQAIDFRRKRDREKPVDPGTLRQQGDETEPGNHPVEELELRSLVQRFLKILPAKWEGVFRARFLERLDQRSAARRLGMRRTTLAYQEIQIRRRLRRFVLEEWDP